MQRFRTNFRMPQSKGNLLVPSAAVYSGNFAEKSLAVARRSRSRQPLA